MVHTDTIRKVIFGNNPLSGFAFSVGQEVNRNNNRFVVSSIEEDGQYLTEYGIPRYNVYIRRVGKKDEEEKMWKSGIGVPTFLEFDDNSDVITVS